LATFGSSAGYHVKIDHGDGFVSICMHMTHYIVKKGDTVEAGQVIGYMGSTGTSTGNHLHFGITYKGNYVNPAKYIDI
jgi:murein DD-endopeptidase MepM/ murein hydrolase activator NlpD